MSKIFACCNWQLKFLGLVIDAWRAAGHEVEYRIGYDPKLHEWADVCFIDVCDRNAQLASKNPQPGARLVIRAIDIECWVRQPKGVAWGNVDALVVPAPHIEALIRSDVKLPEGLPVHRVPFGVDLGKWSYRERDGSGRRLACICYRWSAKGLPLLLQVAARLPDWSLHILGKPSSERWLNAYVDQQVERLGLDVTFTEQVDDVDGWLEDKDVHILCSQKESFSFVTAESATKGIKPAVHRFYGADAIWPAAWLWDTMDEALDLVTGPVESETYRAYVKERYSLEAMMKGLDEACGLGFS